VCKTYPLERDIVVATLAGILVCTIGIVCVLLATHRRGPRAGLGSATLFASLAVFFAMPPTLSFKIARLHDLGVLAVYAFTSLAILHFFNRNQRREFSSLDPFTPLTSPVSGHRLAATDLLDRVPRLNNSANEISLDQNVSRLIDDVVELAKENAVAGGTISIYRAALPSLNRVWIVAPLRNDVSLPRAVVIGLQDQHCHEIARPDWPGNCSLTWFANESERIFQVTAQL